MQPTPLLLSAEEGGRDRMRGRELGFGVPLKCPPFGNTAPARPAPALVHGIVGLSSGPGSSAARVYVSRLDTYAKP